MRRVSSAVQAFVLITLAVAFASAQSKTNVTAQPEPQRVSDTNRDPRLNQKITYQVKLRPVANVTADLCKLTGIRFLAGHDDGDWRVREDCMTIMARDIPVSSLMASIAHVMKFSWSRRGKAPDWTYRLVEDSKAIAEAKRRLAESRQRGDEQRKRNWENLTSASMMTPKELEKIREDQPQIYICAKSGALRPLMEFFQQSPSVREAWLAGEELKISASWLQPGAREALLQALRANLLLESKMNSSADNLEDINSQKSELDGDSQSLVLNISQARSYFPVPPLYVYGKKLNTGFYFRNNDSKLENIRQQALLKSYDEQVPYQTVMEGMRDRLREIQKKERPVYVYSDTQEPLLEHPADPAMAEKLKRKVEDKVVTDMVASLADASSFAIVTDNFRGRTNSKFDKDTEIGKTLDSLSIRFRYNWNKTGRIIELWNLNWYDERDGRLSQAWLETFRRKFRETGTLDIDDLAQLASLTDKQIQRNLSRDRVLRHAVRAVCDRRDYLKMCGSFTPAQHTLIFSEQGLSFANLTPEQQESILKIVSGQSVSFLESLDLAAIGARVRCAREVDGKRFVYTLKASTDFGDIPGQVRFRTPVYVEPPKEGG
jgi:hypothetical protein